MATSKNGVLGGFVGSVNGLVGSFDSGTFYVELKRNYEKVYLSASQRLQNTRFGLLSMFLLIPYYSCFKYSKFNFTPKLSKYQDFIKLNNSVIGVNETIYFDSLKLIRGKAPKIEVSSIYLTAGGRRVYVALKNYVAPFTYFSNHNLYLICYNANSKRWLPMQYITSVDNIYYVFEYDFVPENNVLHFYLAQEVIDKKISSDTLHLYCSGSRGVFYF